MKILYHHRIGSKDGQYVHVQELQQSILGLGHTLVKVEPTQFAKREFGSGSGIVETLRRRSPPIVHELLEIGYGILDQRRLRRAVLQHRPDCIYERYNLFTPAGAWARKRFGLPLLVEVNAPLFEERSKFGGLKLRRLARRSEQRIWRAADFVLPVTEVLADRVRRAGVDDSKIVVIPNGVNLEEFDGEVDGPAAKKRLGLGSRLVLGFTGFVREWHGLERAVNVLGRHGERLDLHLLVVGDGPGCASLIGRADALGVRSRVTVTGIVDRRKVGEMIAAFDVALQPNVVDYASPLKIFEYLAMGKATVAPDLPNIREILTDGTNAILFDPKGDEGLERAVLRLCEEHDLRARLGEAGRRLIDDRDLTWSHNARRVIGLFETLVGARGVDSQVGTRAG